MLTAMIRHLGAKRYGIIFIGFAKTGFVSHKGRVALMIRILISDDSPGVREVLRTYFEKFPEKFQVVGEAANGEEALRLAKELKPDVILLDIRMPILDGIAATRELALSDQSHLVITYTGFPLPQLESIAKRAGAVAHLSKPFDLDDLKRLILEVVAQRRLEVPG